MIRIHLSRRFLFASLFFVIYFYNTANSFPESEKSFKTIYCVINYSDEKSLSDFFWRISGKRFDFTEDIYTASNRIDRLVDRVQAILDMHPENLRITINLYPKYKKGLIASYLSDSDSIRVFADKVTDGILAHEISHAVICNYFDPPPPYKMQEIIAQYVDKHLWEDY